MDRQGKALVEELVRIDEALRENAVVALELAEAFVAAHPDHVDGWIFLGRVLLARARFPEMLQAAERAQAIDPDHPVAQLVLMEALYRCSRSEEAFGIAARLEGRKKFDPVILTQIGNFYAQTNRHADAARCLERVRVLQPTNLGALYSLTASYVALNEMDKTERLLDNVVRWTPHEYDAYYNRSTLRKQKPESNHVAQMEAMLRQPLRSETGEPILCYSLAKELEDLKDHERSFAYLKRGAAARRRTMAYSLEDDLQNAREHIATFDEAFFRDRPPGFRGRRPIFVLGMPRSGTTLVDRILSSHSRVGSVGESNEFLVAALRQSGRSPRGEVSVAGARNLDYELMGREYCRSIDGLLPGTEHVLDKTPTNFYHIGMIAAALPDAPIVHLRRNPVANCYAIYKTLFRSGYDFSYDLIEMGRYYLSYLELMAHWRKVLPDRFLDVDYEDLVANQEAVSRRMVAWCGLEWEDACLSFEKNASPSLTASAAQVRQPIYDSSLNQWRHYERELAPLIRLFEDAGVKID
ncbi:MAG TPA: sulfotransferase [Rhizomicrobium sp.]